jgi:hypothetical protein
MFVEVSLSQTSVLEESSTARVSLAPLFISGSLLSQEREVISRNKAKQKLPNKRTIQAPPSKTQLRKTGVKIKRRELNLTRIALHNFKITS